MRAQTVGLQRVGVHFKNEVRAALKIEAEGDLLLGQPVRQHGELCRRKHVGKGGDDADEDDKGIRPYHPF
jgi:hypothetical protein